MLRPRGTARCLPCLVQRDGGMAVDTSPPLLFHRIYLQSSLALHCGCIQQTPWPLDRMCQSGNSTALCPSPDSRLSGQLEDGRLSLHPSDCSIRSAALHLRIVDALRSLDILVCKPRSLNCGEAGSDAVIQPSGKAVSSRLDWPSIQVVCRRVQVVSAVGSGHTRPLTLQRLLPFISRWMIDFHIAHFQGFRHRSSYSMQTPWLLQRQP